MGTLAARQFVTTDHRTLTLRHGVPADAAACLRFVHGVLDESDHLAMSSGEFKMTLEQETQWLAEHLANPASIILVAAHAHEIVGLLDFRPGRFRKASHRGSFGISIRQAWRGCGVGHAMLAALIEWARSIPSLELITLEVDSTNTRAIALYNRLGFVECGRIPRAHKLGPARSDENSYADEILMHLRLN